MKQSKSMWILAWIITSIVICIFYRSDVKDISLASSILGSFMAGGLFVFIAYGIKNLSTVRGRMQDKKAVSQKAKKQAEEAKVAELKKQSGSIICTSCGGPVGIHEESCPYCKTVNKKYKKPK